MPGFDVWDVVKVPFPYTNRPVQQYRPAFLVVVHDEVGSRALLWVLMITSATHRRLRGDVEISDMRLAGLPARSIVRSAKIATVEGLDAARIGRLAGADVIAVREQIKQTLKGILSAQA